MSIGNVILNGKLHMTKIGTHSVHVGSLGEVS